MMIDDDRLHDDLLPHQDLTTESSELLDFEQEIFANYIDKNALVIMSEGLGVERHLFELIRVYAEAGMFVLVLNLQPFEQEFYLKQLVELDFPRALLNVKIISSGVSADERAMLYTGGGVFFMSSRICVVDMLNGVLPASQVEGILVANAHTLTSELGLEAFIVYFFKLAKASAEHCDDPRITGWVKAFSDQPRAWRTKQDTQSALTAPLSKVANAMSFLYTDSLCLWPRYHVSIAKYLDAHQPKVVEHPCGLTDLETDCHTQLVAILQICLSELKSCAPKHAGLTSEDVDLENLLQMTTRRLKTLLQPFPPIHKCRRMLSEVDSVLHLLRTLVHDDCVSFYGALQECRQALRSVAQREAVPAWLLLPAAETVANLAVKRVFADGKWLFEHKTKWTSLVDTIASIAKESEATRSHSDGSLAPPNAALSSVMILCENEKTCSQVRDVIDIGARPFLVRQFNDLASSLTTDLLNSMTADTKDQLRSLGNDSFSGGVARVSCDDLAVISLKTPRALLLSTLLKNKPKHVILFNSNLATIRLLEVFNASLVEEAIRCELEPTVMTVHLFVYEASIEEQTSLAAIRGETAAFQTLIGEKRTVVVNSTVSPRPEITSESRPGTERPTILVDTREFRSELPVMLFRHGFDVLPITLPISDYVLSPDIIVERKSRADLLQSLASGHLYDQVDAMMNGIAGHKHFALPVLLIENHDSNLVREDHFWRLIVLSQRFPRLRLVWSCSPFLTARLFQSIKLRSGREPEPGMWRPTGSVSDDWLSEEPNSGAQMKSLMNLPHVTSRNVHSLMSGARSIRELLLMSESALKNRLPNHTAVATHLVSLFSKRFHNLPSAGFPGMQAAAATTTSTLDQKYALFRKRKVTTTQSNQ